MLLGEDRGGAGDVRRGHRRARRGGVEIVDRRAHRGAGRAGRDDVDARRGDLRLEALVEDARAAAGELGERVVVVDGADGQRRGRRARGADRVVAALVAGGDHEQGAAGAELVDGRAHRVGAVGRAAAEAHVDHLGATVDGPLHAGDDARLVAAAGVVEDLADQQLRARCDTAAADRDGRDVGAVPEVVGGVAAAAEVLRGGDPAGQVGVRGVDAGVEDGDLDAGAGQPGLPGGGCADLFDVRVGARGDPAVQPDLGLPGDAHLRLASPEGRQRSLVGAHRHCPDARQLGGPACLEGTQVARPRLHDQREGAAVGVAVPVGEQALHVEQLGVDLPAPDQRDRVQGQDLQPVPGLGGAERDALASGGRPHRRRVPAVARGGERDDVTGDQRDRPGGAARGGRWCGRAGGGR